MSDSESHRPLERWDPAADHRVPTVELEVRIRARLAGGEEPGWLQTGRRWIGSRVSLAAAAAALVALVALTLTRLEPESGSIGRQPAVATPAIQTATGAESVRMVYTASNGVRIYWSVPSSSGT